MGGVGRTERCSRVYWLRQSKWDMLLAEVDQKCTSASRFTVLAHPHTPAIIPASPSCPVIPLPYSKGLSLATPQRYSPIVTLPFRPSAQITIMPVSPYSDERSPSLPDTAASLCDNDPSLGNTEMSPRFALEIDRPSVSHVNTAVYPSTDSQPHDADSFAEQEKDQWDEKTDASDFDYLGEKHFEEDYHGVKDEQGEQRVTKAIVDLESQASTRRRNWTVSDFIPSIVMLGFATVIAVPVGLKATGHLKSA